LAAPELRPQAAIKIGHQFIANLRDRALQFAEIIFGDLKQPRHPAVRGMALDRSALYGLKRTAFLSRPFRPEEALKKAIGAPPPDDKQEKNRSK
jgi:hypothetical protein